MHPMSPASNEEGLLQYVLGCVNPYFVKFLFYELVADICAKFAQGLVDF